MNSINNFLFSSVGDNTNFDSLWINSNMNYHIYLIYYGDNNKLYEKYKSKVQFIEKRKGSKFQNFKYFYDKYINIINNYERFFILDDDIIFNVDDINNMFKISKEYNLEICGPSFSLNGKISHKITQNKPNILLSYTNFVEVGVPLFNRIALDKLMEKLDYSLIGWGIDFLYIICNGIEKKKSYAIIHKVICENPKDIDKLNNKREVSKMVDYSLREQKWKLYTRKYKIQQYFKLCEYENILIE